MHKSLSARLLILTILFVMLAEVMIFLPSVARYRISWLEERLGAAHLAILTLDAAPDAMVSEALQDQLLSFVGVRSIAVRRADARLVLLNDMPPEVDASYDLAEESPLEMIHEALRALWSDGDAVIRVVGPSPKTMPGEPEATIEIVLDEAPLCEAILGFAGRIFVLSLLISIVTAGLVFWVLRWQFVHPMRRLTRHLVRFREAPDEARRIIQPSARADELGVAERELAAMQTALHETLTQRRHLAALGTAVAKIQHDLRGILSSALVVSDRLEASADPEVRRVTPTLIDSIDRAVKLCSQTLDYVGRDQPLRAPSLVSLAPLIDEIGMGLRKGVILDNKVAAEAVMLADRDQLHRILNNLLRNAAEAGAQRITLSTAIPNEGPHDDQLCLVIHDNGPGLPWRARNKLFQPFEGSARAGGAGLGLAIARELALSNGGDLVLEETGETGTRFFLTLPMRPEE